LINPGRALVSHAMVLDGRAKIFIVREERGLLPWSIVM